MECNETLDFFRQLMDHVQQEFAKRKLTDGDIIVFYRGALCQLLESTISDLDYSKEEATRTLKSVSSNLELAIKEGWELRKTKEKTQS